MRYLLDTNICIALIRQQPQEVLTNIKKRHVTDIAISTLTIAELEHGVHKSTSVQQNQQALNQFLIPFSFLDFDYAAVQAYGPIRAQLEQQGTSIGPLDTLIASQAVAYTLVLVTNNTKEFSRIPQLPLEDWTKP